MVDHLLVGCAELEEGISLLERRTGVRAARGGRHPGAGTHNALLSLGYNEKEAHAAIKGLAPDIAVADGIRAALKALAKS